MEKIADIKPTAELSPEMIKTICHAISPGILQLGVEGR
jgi:hypothetical protein